MPMTYAKQPRQETNLREDIPIAIETALVKCEDALSRTITWYDAEQFMLDMARNTMRMKPKWGGVKRFKVTAP